jgi:hypothetical protein
LKVVKNILGVSRFELEPELFKAIVDILDVKIASDVPVFYPKIEVGDVRLEKVEGLYRQFGYKAHAGVVPHESEEKLYGYTLTRVYEQKDVNLHRWATVHAEVSAMMCRVGPKEELVLDEITGSISREPVVLTARGHLVVSESVKKHLEANGVVDVVWGEAKAVRQDKPIKSAVKLFHLRPTHVFPKLSIEDNNYFDFNGDSVKWGNAEGFSVSRGEYTSPQYVYKKNVLKEVAGFDCALMYETLGFSVKFRPTFVSARVIGLLYEAGCEFNWDPLCFR